MTMGLSCVPAGSGDGPVEHLSGEDAWRYRPEGEDPRKLPVEHLSGEDAWYRAGEHPGAVRGSWSSEAWWVEWNGMGDQ
jgi:hypothetical protein